MSERSSGEFEPVSRATNPSPLFPQPSEMNPRKEITELYLWGMISCFFFKLKSKNIIIFSNFLYAYQNDGKFVPNFILKEMNDSQQYP